MKTSFSNFCEKNKNPFNSLSYARLYLQRTETYSKKLSSGCVSLLINFDISTFIHNICNRENINDSQYF